MNDTTTTNDGGPAMNRTEITKRLRLAMDRVWSGQENVTDATRFAEDLDYDSLDRLELVIEVEDEFEVCISDADAEGISTFGQAVSYLASRLAERERGQR